MNRDDPQVAALLASAAIGKDAEQFMKSELGRTLIGMARQDAAEAMEKLKTVWSWRTRRIRELQNQITQAERFEHYLIELAVRGQQSMQALEDPEE